MPERAPQIAAYGSTSETIAAQVRSVRVRLSDPAQISDNTSAGDLRY